MVEAGAATSRQRRADWSLIACVAQVWYRCYARIMDLMQGESLVWRGRPSWRAMMSFYTKWIVVGIVPLVAGILVDHFRHNSHLTGWAALVTAVILAAALLIGWIRRVATLYQITDRRIQIRHGIISRQTREALIDRVQNVTIRQSVFDRLFGVGTLDFDTAGMEGADFCFAGVPDPNGLQQRIAREALQRGGHQGGLATPPAGT
jgi:membrane protein YdbS with pleckstrin-like domain